ncbi:J domain-containing protein [Candidatus Micrarchaeota archaeon]|nr:J domain-containing protein [Candidatus Micrarchaeota archaeon]
MANSDKSRDYYADLGVPRAASADEIKRAWRRIAKATHPDHHSGNKILEERFKLASQAYEVLGDPRRKRKYDSLWNHQNEHIERVIDQFVEIMQFSGKPANQTLFVILMHQSLPENVRAIAGRKLVELYKKERDSDGLRELILSYPLQKIIDLAHIALVRLNISKKEGQDGLAEFFGSLPKTLQPSVNALKIIRAIFAEEELKLARKRQFDELIIRTADELFEAKNLRALRILHKKLSELKIDLRPSAKTLVQIKSRAEQLEREKVFEALRREFPRVSANVLRNIITTSPRKAPDIGSKKARIR